jgi:Immunity protein 51
VPEQVSPFVEAVVSERARAEGMTARRFVWGPFTLWDGDSRGWRLQVTSFDVDDAINAAVASRGHEASGYFWQDVARYLVAKEAPGLADSLEYDPEADMFEAIGDRACLLQLSEVMRPAVTSPAAVVGVIDAATAAGVEFAT